MGGRLGKLKGATAFCLRAGSRCFCLSEVLVQMEEKRKEERRRRRGSRRLSRNSEDEDTEGSTSTHERCFYASFKIYLNPDSRRSSGVEGEMVEEEEFVGTGEVVRIEKTEEVSDDSISDEDTLSLSNENLLDKEALTDTEEAIAIKEEAKEDIEIKITEDCEWVEELPELTQIAIPAVVTLRPRSGSEAPGTERSSRSSLRGGRGGFERTQSVDRVFRRAGSPVFYLEPTDWVRTQGSTPSPRNSPLLKEPLREVREGSSPLPYKDKLPNPMKLLESLGCGLDVLTESEENLSLEVEELTSVRDHLGLEVEVMDIGTGPPPRTKSDPGVGWTGMETRRVEEDLREEERRKSEDVVRRRLGEENEERRRSEELLRRREESRSRSVTPGRFGESRHRKTPIPVLCSRGAWMVTILMRRAMMTIVEL